jgi:hypothetical protein
VIGAPEPRVALDAIFADMEHHLHGVEGRR